MSCHTVISDSDKKVFFTRLSVHHQRSRQEIRLQSGVITRIHLCPTFIIDNDAKHSISFEMGGWTEYVDGKQIDSGPMEIIF